MLEEENSNMYRWVRVFFPHIFHLGTFYMLESYELYSLDHILISYLRFVIFLFG
jgi:hypothetical protein